MRRLLLRILRDAVFELAAVSFFFIILHVCSLYEQVNAPIARSREPEKWCSVRSTLQLPCLILSVMGWAGQVDCSRVRGFPDADGAPPADVLQRDCQESFAGLTTDLGLEDETTVAHNNGVKASSQEARSQSTASERATAVDDRPRGNSPWQRQRIEVVLTPSATVAGYVGALESHAVHIIICPALKDLWTLRDAFNSAVTAWHSTNDYERRCTNDSSYNYCNLGVGGDSTSLDWALRKVLDGAGAYVEVNGQRTDLWMESLR